MAIDGALQDGSTTTSRRLWAVALASVLLALAGCSSTDTGADSPVQWEDDLVGTFEDAEGELHVTLEEGHDFSATGTPDGLVGDLFEEDGTEVVGEWMLHGHGRTLFLKVLHPGTGETMRVVPVEVISADELSVRQDVDADLTRVS
ncbi:hypothetical protein ABE437_03740 [Isoptericola cucumis]|uniref:hypothetical protein n=1 Tax=Isoptericola cucumis TaxID=1776856 RepID=UPI003207B06B